MKKIATIFVIGALISMMAAGTFAECYQTPLQACAGVTGQSLKSIMTQREAGITYDQLAQDAGELEAYHEAILQMKREQLALRVEAGTLTQAQMDALLKDMEEQQILCDGTNDCLGLGSGCLAGYHYDGCGHRSDQNGMYASGHGCGARTPRMNRHHL